MSIQIPLLTPSPPVPSCPSHIRNVHRRGHLQDPDGENPRKVHLNSSTPFRDSYTLTYHIQYLDCHLFELRTAVGKVLAWIKRFTPHPYERPLVSVAIEKNTDLSSNLSQKAPEPSVTSPAHEWISAFAARMLLDHSVLNICVSHQTTVVRSTIHAYVFQRRCTHQITAEGPKL